MTYFGYEIYELSVAAGRCCQAAFAACTDCRVEGDHGKPLPAVPASRFSVLKMLMKNKYLLVN
jgi:hypothetical protein